MGHKQQDPDAAAQAIPGYQGRQPGQQGGAGDRRDHDIEAELEARLGDEISHRLKRVGNAVTLHGGNQQRSNKHVAIHPSRVAWRRINPVVEALRRQASNLNEQECAYQGA